MSRNLLLLFFAAAMVALALKYVGVPEQSAAVATPSAPAVVVDVEPPASPDVLEPPGAQAPGLLFDINAHTVEELEAILHRVESLAQAPQTRGEPTEIALVLHGPEVAFFAVQNYAEYKNIVDLAAKLSAFQVIEVRMCQTMMQQMGIDSSDIPAFIEQVPFGPAEVERLVGEGYVVM